MIFATGRHLEPWLSVYPDSDKVSGPEGILLRSSAVGYWHTGQWRIRLGLGRDDIVVLASPGTPS